ncbi:MAG: hypothetical protein HZB31_01410 [Nitrospirae bacterium]|nr:hypothetical protein [Nitrospirota bacterium]
MGWPYDNLKNEELQRLAIVRFGDELRPLREIGRQAIIEELKADDRFSELNQTERTYNNSRGRQ